MIWNANRNLDEYLKKGKEWACTRRNNSTYTEATSQFHKYMPVEKFRTRGTTIMYMRVLIIQVYVAGFPMFSGSKDHIQYLFNSADLAKIISSLRSF
jgi:hypothetical protein